MSVQEPNPVEGCNEAYHTIDMRERREQLLTILSHRPGPKVLYDMNISYDTAFLAPSLHETVRRLQFLSLLTTVNRKLIERPSPAELVKNKILRDTLVSPRLHAVQQSLQFQQLQNSLKRSQSRGSITQNSQDQVTNTTRPPTPLHHRIRQEGAPTSTTVTANEQLSNHPFDGLSNPHVASRSSYQQKMDTFLVPSAHPLSHPLSNLDSASSARALSQSDSVENLNLCESLDQRQSSTVPARLLFV